MRQKTDEELNEIIRDKGGYVLEAREAAIEELENRNSDPEIESFRQSISNERTKLQERSNSGKRESRMILLPKEAPLMMKIIGFVLYAFWVISIFQFLYFVYTAPVPITGLFFWLLVVGVYILSFLLINSIVRGQNWARIVYTVLTGIAMILTLAGVALTKSMGSLSIDPIDILWRMIDVVIVILLFIEPCKQWFWDHPNKHETSQVLDDLA